MDAFHRQHRDVRGGRRCPCCTSDTKPEGNRVARSRLRAETRAEIAADDVAAEAELAERIANWYPPVSREA